MSFSSTDLVALLVAVALAALGGHLFHSARGFVLLAGYAAYVAMTLAQA
ncbi:MAG: hypothetical protein H8K05_09345 [Nitrospira sp.]|nr:hypothetical protein [Nitrospira sp.]